MLLRHNLVRTTVILFTQIYESGHPKLSYSISIQRLGVTPRRTAKLHYSHFLLRSSNSLDSSFSFVYCIDVHILAKKEKILVKVTDDISSKAYLLSSQAIIQDVKICFSSQRRTSS